MTRLDVRFAPHFIEGARGLLFVHLVAPANGSAESVVLLLPPIGEEMNKSRRMLSLQAQSLAKHGLIAIIPDLYGLGDSEGSIENASLDIWQSDLEQVCTAICENFQPTNLCLLAVRSAAFLIDRICQQKPPMDKLLLWSPESKGSRFVKNLYRQALISARNQGDTNTTAKSIKQRTIKEGFVEIAGYRYSVDFLNQLEQAALPTLPPSDISATWIDVRPEKIQDSQATVPPIVNRWREAGIPVSHQIVAGPPFWQTAEICVVPELIEATSAAITGNWQ